MKTFFDQPLRETAMPVPKHLRAELIGSQCDAVPGVPAMEEWEEPSDLIKPIPSAPAFPMECLPYRLASYAQDEAERMQAEVDLIAIPMLVTSAGLIGKSASIRPKKYDDWSEIPCLWGASIAPPASLKSQTLFRATAPLRRLQEKLSEEHAANMKKWQAEQEQSEVRLKAWQQQSKTLLKNDPEAVLPPKPEGPPPPPIPGRIFAVDSTLEKHCDLQVYSRGMSLIRDELSGFLLNMSRYNNGSDRQFFLECNSGGSYAVDRIGRGESFISDLYLNIFGTIQPKVAKNLFSIDSATIDGFWDRFGLLAYPKESQSYNHVDRWPDADRRKLYNDVCDKLFATKWEEVLITDDGGGKPFCRFDPEAQNIFDEWLIRHMNAIRSTDGETDPIAGHLGKARGLLARLCLVIHLTAWAAGEMPDPKTVEPQSLERAVLLLETYLIPMWRRVFAAFGRTAADDGASRLAKWIKEEKLTEVRVRDIRRKHWRGLLEEREIQSALDMLVAHRWLGPIQLASKTGRNSIRYNVNPLVHGMHK
jgi:putative DNA primase/helicase